MEHRTHRVRYNSRRRTLEVQEKWHVTPKMLRMVLGGEDFEDFTTPSADDHIKLYVPSEAGDLAARDFTPRHFDRRHPVQWLQATGYWVTGRADAYERLDS